MTHHLKILPEYFEPVLSKTKNFEVRNNDRNFKVGDNIILEEFQPETKSYTGRKINATITYITDFMQRENYVVFAFKTNK